MHRAAHRPRIAATRVFLATSLAASALLSRPVAAQPQVQWRELGAPARSDGAMVWDSRRGRALLFGGDGAFWVPYRSPWQFLRSPRPHWEPLATTPDGPPLRSGMCAVYDSVGDRVLLFGGRVTLDESGTDELWQLRLDGQPRWLQLSYAGGPSPRYDATMILDRDRRLVLFGGDGGGGDDDAVWLLPLDAPALQWQKLDAYQIGLGPGPRTRHGAAYSATAHCMLVFGGEQRLFEPLRGLVRYATCPPLTWRLSLATPTHWEPALADTSVHPLAEVAGALVTDATGRYAWLMPGEQAYGVDDPTDWRYDFSASAWSRGHPGFGGPGRRPGAAACLARDAGDILIHGGATNLYMGMADLPLAETCALTAASVPGWVGLSRMPGISDRPWFDPRAHFDDARRQLVTWTREGVWTCDVATDATWRLQPIPPGDGPQLDDAMSAVDPVRRRLLVFGGVESTGGGYVEREADRLWSWPLDGPGPWSSTAIAGPVPTGIRNTQCAFDVGRDRVIALPSLRTLWTPLDTVPVLEWSGDAAHWARLPIAGNPPAPRSDATFIFDPVRDRMILQGGVTAFSGDGNYARDLWSLSLGGTPRWELEISSPHEYKQAARSGLAVDPTLDRLLLVGGVGLTAFGLGPHNVIQTTSFDDPAVWEDLDPTGRSPMDGGGPLAFDAAADRMVWWNGRQLWEITWPFDTPPPYGAAVVKADAGGVNIRWPGEQTGPYSADVDRSTDGGRTWARLRSVVPEADGALAFTDSTPPPGGQAVYRATIQRSGATRVLGTASTLLGATTPATLTLVAPRPNPARDDVVLELAMPADATVTFELYDVTGRLAAPALRRTMPAGTSVFTAPLARGLRPGLYMLRASDGHRSVNARLFVVR